MWRCQIAIKLGGGGAGHVVESDHLIPSFSIFSKERR